MKVVVIGNGIAGITAAIRIRQHDPKARIVVVSGESDYFFSRPALMYIFMGQISFEDTKPYEDWFWGAQRIERVHGWVTSIDTDNRRLGLIDGHPIEYDKLIIATGSSTNKFGWPGQDLERVEGMVNLTELAALEKCAPYLDRAVVVGGGLIGIELTEMLHSRGIHVTILAREPSYWLNALPSEESAMVGRAIHKEAIDLHLETELQEIIDDGKGGVGGIITKNGDKIDCQFVGLSAGVHPNLSALEGSPIRTNRGVIVDKRFQTNIPDVYAIGDCAEITGSGETRGTVEQLWYTGRMHGEVVGDVICGRERTHDRGILFNSAKFLDLEWHTYGHVPGGLKPDSPLNEKQLYWEHSSGLHSARIVLREDQVVGFNTMGIRYRHRVCERFIAEKRTIDYVLDHLAEANFDPEFYRRHETTMIGTFQEQLR